MQKERETKTRRRMMPGWIDPKVSLGTMIAFFGQIIIIGVPLLWYFWGIADAGEDNADAITQQRTAAKEWRKRHEMRRGHSGMIDFTHELDTDVRLLQQGVDANKEKLEDIDNKLDLLLQRSTGLP